MKKFTLITENTQLGPVTTQKYGIKSINTLNTKIKAYLDNTYSKYGYSYGFENKDIDIDGFVINTEYLNKMVNNYTVFKKLIDMNNITNEDDFYRFMESNLYEIYNTKGKYFNIVTLPIVISTTRKGNIGEQKSLDFFKQVILDKKNVNITMEKPTLQEDIKGIDGKFNWGGKVVTIQVKPYDSYVIDNGIMKVYSQGSLSLNTDYLILYKDDSFIIVKGKDVTITGNHFNFNSNNIISNK